MIILKRIGLYLLIIAFILVSVGYLLPRHIRVERSHLIKGDQTIVFQQINDFRLWYRWSPWLRMDPKIKLNFEGLPGKGSKYCWTSENRNVGNGTASMIESLPDSLLKVQLDFGFNGGSLATFHLKKESDSSVMVSWILESDMGNNPLARYMGLMMDRWVGKDFEQGLALLDSVSQLAATEMQISIREIPSFSYIGIESTVDFQKINIFMESSFSKLYGAAAKNNSTITGPPFALYKSYDQTSAIVVAGIPVNPETTVQNGMDLYTMEKHKSVMAILKGSYDGLPLAYHKMKLWASDRNLTIKNWVWESYLTDPTLESDTSKWVTEIFFPIDNP